MATWSNQTKNVVAAVTSTNHIFMDGNNVIFMDANSMVFIDGAAAGWSNQTKN